MSDERDRYSQPPQLSLAGSLALGVVGVGSQIFFAFTGRWFLFGASVALGVGLPVLGLTAPSRWEDATRAIIGERLDARSIKRRQASIAASALGIAATAILVTALVAR
jgi:hypothetical protein